MLKNVMARVADGGHAADVADVVASAIANKRTGLRELGTLASGLEVLATKLNKTKSTELSFTAGKTLVGRLNKFLQQHLESHDSLTLLGHSIRGFGSGLAKVLRRLERTAQTKLAGEAAGFIVGALQREESETDFLELTAEFLPLAGELDEETRSRLNALVNQAADAKIRPHIDTLHRYEYACHALIGCSGYPPFKNYGRRVIEALIKDLDTSTIPEGLKQLSASVMDLGSLIKNEAMANQVADALFRTIERLQRQEAIKELTEAYASVTSPSRVAQISAILQRCCDIEKAEEMCKALRTFLDRLPPARLESPKFDAMLINILKCPDCPRDLQKAVIRRLGIQAGQDFHDSVWEVVRIPAFSAYARRPLSRPGWIEALSERREVAPPQASLR
jgi:hypothetical protein